MLFGKLKNINNRMGGDDMEIKYVQNGEKGRTCADCKHFERDVNMQGAGKCFGNEVSAEGGCNFFEARD